MCLQAAKQQITHSVRVPPGHLCEENRNSHQLGVYTGYFSWVWCGPTKKAALITFCTSGWHQWAYTLLAPVLGWWATCPQPLTLNLSPPAHSSLKAVFCWVSAPSLECNFCQLMIDGWINGGDIDVLPQTPNFCPKGSEIELVCWQTCRCTSFLSLIWGRSCDLVFYKNKVLFWMTEHC